MNIKLLVLFSVMSAACAYLCGEGLGKVECIAGVETCAYIQMQWKCMSCRYMEIHCHTATMAEDCRLYCDSLKKDEQIKGLNITILNLTDDKENLKWELEANKQSAQRDCCLVQCPWPVLLGVGIGIVALLLVFVFIICCRKKHKGRSERSIEGQLSQQLTDVKVDEKNTVNPTNPKNCETEYNSTEESQPDAQGEFSDLKVNQKDLLKAISPENHAVNNERAVLLPTGAALREDPVAN